MSDEEVTAGEKVLTSGGDQIFPKGLPVGTVTKVGKGKDLFLNIKIRPAADLSKLEEVLVLVEKQERQAVADEKGHVRAADILAQRLPSVPDKPAETAPGAANPVKTPGSNGAASVSTGGALKPKPVSPAAGTATQTARNAAGIAAPVTEQPQSTKPAQPVTIRPKPQTQPDGTAVPRTETSKPAIIEEKPKPPENPAAIQPAPQTQSDPNNPN
jgi:rod shape-determining protein MreC